MNEWRFVFPNGDVIPAMWSFTKRLPNKLKQIPVGNLGAVSNLTTFIHVHWMSVMVIIKHKKFQSYPLPIPSMGRTVYFPTWMVDFYGKCREIYPFSHNNNGLVENCPKWKETILLERPIFHFHDCGRKSKPIMNLDVWNGKKGSQNHTSWSLPLVSVTYISMYPCLIWPFVTPK